MTDKPNMEQKLKINTALGSALSDEDKAKIADLLQQKADHKALKAQKKKERKIRSYYDLSQK